MIGDGDGNTTYDFKCDASEIEEVTKYVDILNRLNPLKGHWGIILDNLPEKYPGEYIGLSEEEYNTLIYLLHLEDAETRIENALYDCIRSEEGYTFLVFKRVDIYYYDENNRKYKVVIDND